MIGDGVDDDVHGIDHELKMLRVIHQTKQTHAMDIVANYCGAHSIPKGSTAAAATKDIVENQVYLVARLHAHACICYWLAS